MSLAFSAVLLAGGRSSRMGRDKAEILLPDGRPLWRRQLEDVLRPLGPVELFFSGPPRTGMPVDVRVLPDATPNLGPLSGIAAALEATNAPLVVVLAVDLPAMTAGFFREYLLSASSPTGRGAVGFSDADGFFEPLAAVYPVSAHGLAAEHLRGPDRSLQSFVRAAAVAGLVTPVAIPPEAAVQFINWNRPEDVV